jgi:hypothetical protein
MGHLQACTAGPWCQTRMMHSPVKDHRITTLSNRENSKAVKLCRRCTIYKMILVVHQIWKKRKRIISLYVCLVISSTQDHTSIYLLIDNTEHEHNATQKLHKLSNLEKITPSLYWLVIFNRNSDGWYWSVGGSRLTSASYIALKG